VIDLGEGCDENACNLMRANLEFASNEIDESDLQYEKHDERAEDRQNCLRKRKMAQQCPKTKDGENCLRQ
jgi:hypothetical protein